MERWIEQPAELAPRLIDLLVNSKHSANVVWRERLEPAFDSSQVPSRSDVRLHWLLDELVCTASGLLMVLGPPAREALLRAYEAAGPGSKERRWFLITLSRMRDLALEPFFDGLKPEDFDPEGTTDAVRSFQNAFEFYCATHAFEQGGEQAIFDAVRHEREGWRSAAVMALTRVGDERAKAALKVLTGDTAESVRSSARYQLEWLERKGSGSSGPSAE
jgi:hypothetical protein